MFSSLVFIIKNTNLKLFNNIMINNTVFISILHYGQLGRNGRTKRQRTQRIRKGLAE
jgi:hypothetical protein